MSAPEPGLAPGAFDWPRDPPSLAFGSLERANDQRPRSDQLRLMLETQEASVFFLALARLFDQFSAAVEARVSLGDGLQVFSHFVSAETGEPISVLERCGELYDLAEAQKKSVELSALSAQTSQRADERLSMDRLFDGAWERFTRLAPSFSNTLCSPRGARYVFSPGSAPELARRAGFERLACLMEKDALAESVAPSSASPRHNAL